MYRAMMARVAYLDQVLAFRLGDERLKLGRCEGVDQSSLRNNEEQDLGASENRQFVSLHT